MYTDDSTLDTVVEEHIHRVDTRVGGAAELYSAERQDVRRAADLIRPLRQALGLTEFLGTVGSASGKPQFRLMFRSDTYGPTVLKVYGRRRPGESRIQQLWRTRGVRVVEVLDAGDDPTSWLLMPVVHDPPLADGDLTNSAAAITRDLAKVMGRAHDAVAAISIANEGWFRDIQPLEAAIGRHLGTVLISLQRTGYAVRTDWWADVQRLCAGHETAVLHGDLAAGNVLRHPASGDLTIIDTCGYLGPREFDAARWAARIGGARGAEALLQSWMESEPFRDEDLARGLLGLELLMEAGVREVVKQENAQLPNFPDSTTVELLDASHRLLDSSSGGSQ